MARLAAPHSSASICMICGTFAAIWPAGRTLFATLRAMGPRYSRPNRRASGWYSRVVTVPAYTPSGRSMDADAA